MNTPAVVKTGSWELAVNEHDPAIASLVVSKDDYVPAEILTLGGTKERVVLGLGNDDVVGWVPKSAIQIVKEAPGSTFGYGRGSGAHGSPKHLALLTCPSDVEVVVPGRAGLRVVGHIASGTVIDVIEHASHEDARRSRVAVPHAGIEIDEHVRLLAIVDGVGCAEVVPH